MAAVDIHGFVADLKDHAVEHGFHIHDERHFVETYSLDQTWEIDAHPEDACGGPLDLHLALRAEARTLISFEDRLVELGDDFESVEDTFKLPLYFNWSLPPMASAPDLLVLTSDIAGVTGLDLPVEVSAVEAHDVMADTPEKGLRVVGHVDVSLRSMFLGQQYLCDPLDRAKELSMYLLEQAEHWS